MRKTINKVSLRGRVYDFTIAEKVTGEGSKNPGTNYIGGNLSIATDDDCLNVVDVNFTYVTETTKNGNKNATYAALKKIINDNKTILTVGKDEATKVKIDSALGLNDFYTDRNGEETLVSAKRVTGGFVTIVSAIEEDEDKRNTFEVDMLINNVTHIDADEEKHIDKDFVRIKGVVFDFRNAILPVEFIVKSESGMKYFESLDVSPQNLVFTKVWGVINSETIVRRVEEESAFGEPSVKEYTSKKKEWIVTGTSKPDATYEIGDAETGITADEIKTKMADREVYLAEVKKKADDYKASKAAASGATNVASAPAALGGFNF
jgi:hypothetical protein